MPNAAKIYTYSIIHIASTDFLEKSPYVIAVIETEQGRSLTRVEGYKEGQQVEIGMEVSFLEYDENGKAVYQFN